LLEPLIEERGRPENVCSDNGPEFTSRRMLGWAEDWKVGLVHIQPARPMQNGHVETRVHADAEAWDQFESGIRLWGIGSCFITLTPEQYKKLNASRTAPVPKLKQ
jgi:transposase InsO family protein